MKLSLFLITIFLLYFIDAASLKTLSEKLSIIEELNKVKNDNTKEKVPNDELIISEIYGNINENDGDVSELNNLKSNKVKSYFEDTKRLDENLESSLKKLRNTHLKLSKKESLKSLPIPSEVSELTTENNKILYQQRNESFLNPYTMLRDLNGKYSAYEIAQYIFWTGDEAGIANAVEELIDERLMTRENAVEFLNDVRLGIDYLEHKYKTGDNKNTPITLSTTTTQEPSKIEDIPFNYDFKFRSSSKTNFGSKTKFDDDEIPTLSPIAVKALEKIPSLASLAEIHRESKNSKSKYQHESPESDENEGRSHLKDFLFGEYSLEEVIYQLAKTMFTQSLTHGSEESQAALQKLTQFLENEGKHGRISPMLQKKILDVLLAALSDTLSENPEILKNPHLSLKE